MFGEYKITFKGEELVMRSTIECVRSIENDLGMGVVSVLNRVAKFEYTLNDLEIVLFHGLKGGGNDIAKERITHFISEIGTSQAAVLVTEFVRTVFVGSENAKKIEEVVKV